MSKQYNAVWSYSVFTLSDTETDKEWHVQNCQEVFILHRDCPLVHVPIWSVSASLPRYRVNVNVPLGKSGKLLTPLVCFFFA